MSASGRVRRPSVEVICEESSGLVRASERPMPESRLAANVICSISMTHVRTQRLKNWDERKKAITKRLLGVYCSLVTNSIFRGAIGISQRKKKERKKERKQE